MATLTLEQKISELLNKQSTINESMLGTDEAAAASAGIQQTGLPVGTPNPGDVTPPVQGGSAIPEEDELDPDAPGVDASAKQGTGAAAASIVMKGDANTAFVQGMEESINAIFAGQELNEEVKTKATALFEAAVIARTNHEVAILKEQFEKESDEKLKAMKATLEEQVDSYMSYAIEDWAKSNIVNINKGLRQEITESFMSNLKDLFQESMLNVPDDSVDVISGLVEANDLLKNQNNESVEKLLEARKEAEAKEKALNEQIESLQKTSIIESVAKGLTQIDQEKLKTLVEGVEFSNKELFEEKVTLIKNTHFGQAKGSSSLLKEETKHEVKTDGTAIDAYVTALKHLSR